MGQAIEQLLKDTTRGEWEFPPARPPDRKIRSLGANPWEVEKAKEQCEDDKFAKSAVESVRSRLAWWRKRGKEHKVSPYPITVEHLQLLGSLFKRAGHRSAGHTEWGEERAHPVGDTLNRMLWIGSFVRVNVRVQGAFGPLRSAVLTICRSCRIGSGRRPIVLRRAHVFCAKELFVVLGGQSAKLNFPLPDARKSRSSKVKGVGAAFSICRHQNRPASPWQKTSARLRMFDFGCRQRVLWPGQGGQEVVPWCSPSWTKFLR